MPRRVRRGSRRTLNARPGRGGPRQEPRTTAPRRAFERGSLGRPTVGTAAEGRHRRKPRARGAGGGKPQPARGWGRRTCPPRGRGPPRREPLRAAILRPRGRPPGRALVPHRGGGRFCGAWGVRAPPKNVARGAESRRSRGPRTQGSPGRPGLSLVGAPGSGSPSSLPAEAAARSGGAREVAPSPRRTLGTFPPPRTRGRGRRPPRPAARTVVPVVVHDAGGGGRGRPSSKLDCDVLRKGRGGGSQEPRRWTQGAG